jgi:hypothetical protein
MKRATVLLLALSLVAVPTFASLHKVASARCISLERITGAWRMEVECDQTRGTILLLDTGDRVQYVGQGMFRGWTQSELSALYRSLIPKADTVVLMQLG